MKLNENKKLCCEEKRMFKTIKEEKVSSEIVEKKSKFIGSLFYVESVEEAEEYIRQINKKYFDSRHNCYAFSVYTENGVVNRFSDDGEPSGTARSAYVKHTKLTRVIKCINCCYKIFWWNFTSAQEA